MESSEKKLVLTSLRKELDSILGNVELLEDILERYGKLYDILKSMGDILRRGGPKIKVQSDYISPHQL